MTGCALPSSQVPSANRFVGLEKDPLSFFKEEREEQRALMVSASTIRLQVCAGFLLFGASLVAVLLYDGDGTSMAWPTLAHLFLFSG